MHKVYYQRLYRHRDPCIDILSVLFHFQAFLCPFLFDFVQKNPAISKHRGKRIFSGSNEVMGPWRKRGIWKVRPILPSHTVFTNDNFCQFSNQYRYRKIEVRYHSAVFPAGINCMTLDLVINSVNLDLVFGVFSTPRNLQGKPCLLHAVLSCCTLYNGFLFPLGTSFHLRQRDSSVKYTKHFGYKIVRSLLTFSGPASRGHQETQK